MSDQLQETFQELAKRAKADGAELELLATGGESLSIVYQDRKLEKFQSSTSRTAGLRVVLGEAQGCASTENFSKESLERTYKAALENARTVRVKGDGVLPMAAPSPLGDEMKDLFRLEDIPMEKKMEIARDLEAKVLARDPRVKKVPYSGFSDSNGWVRILNTKGLDRYRQSNAYTGYAYAMAEEGTAKKMDGDSFFAREFEQINVEELAKTAVERAVARLAATKMKTTTMPVLFDREAASVILSMVYPSLSAKELYQKKSLLEGKLGQKIAADGFEILDDPFDRRLTACRPFDGEGSATQKTTLIENGVLKFFMTNLEYAKKMGLPHTANASRSPGSDMDISSSNLIVKTGTKTREQLLKSAPRMLLLTEITASLHAGFKEASGDFSLPAEGFLVENGEIKGPVDQLVVSGNILELLPKIIGIGDTHCKASSSVLVPDLLVNDLSIAGE